MVVGFRPKPELRQVGLCRGAASQNRLSVTSCSMSLHVKVSYADLHTNCR